MAARFEGSFNLGNLIEVGGLLFQAVVILIGMAGFWTALSDRIGSLEKQTASIDVLVNQMQTNNTALAVDDRRLTTLEGSLNNQQITNSKILDSLTLIQADIAALKARGN